jgi:hypothetical protein
MARWGTQGRIEVGRAPCVVTAGARRFLSAVLKEYIRFGNRGAYEMRQPFI